MNVIREINRINEIECEKGLVGGSGSWHDDYKDSPYIFVGGLPFDLNEGDILSIFEQYGSIVDVNLIRDKDSGKSRGFAFLAYKDQRSTVLAVDNFNGIKILNRTIRVDHVSRYRPPKTAEGNKAAAVAFTDEIEFFKSAAGDLLLAPGDFQSDPKSTASEEAPHPDTIPEDSSNNSNRRERLKALKRSMTPEQWQAYKDEQRSRKQRKKE